MAVERSIDFSNSNDPGPMVAEHNNHFLGTPRFLLFYLFRAQRDPCNNGCHEWVTSKQPSPSFPRDQLRE